jgi:hypothetical protein
MRYSVLVNGKPCGYISSRRGLRQGDPISPYLFLLCAEGLNSLLKKAMDEGLVKRVLTSRRGLRISHLFFADDNLLFCQSTIVQWDRLMAILRMYELVSRQRLNNNKTTLFFSKNTPQVDKEAILEISQISAPQRYDSYLSLLALVGKSRTTAFKNILDRVWKRIHDWKVKFIS